jgi:ABC-type molybdenum transport system ATPase subunit/photorepair protein PhrA
MEPVEPTPGGDEHSAPGTERPAPVVRLRGVSVERGGRTVLRDVDLDIAAGEITGIIGPSGSGKSTMMRPFASTTSPTGASTTSPAGSGPACRWRSPC